MKKKGFTLIELLAVIVILAIILVIAIPQILRVIEESRKSAAKTSALGYIKAINYNNKFAEAGEAGYTPIVSADVENINVKIKGDEPTSGTVTVNGVGKVTAASLCILGYAVEYDGTSATVGGKCSGNTTYTPGDGVYFDPVTASPCDSSTFNKNNIINGTSTCYKWRVITVGDKASKGNVTIQMDHNLINATKWTSEEWFTTGPDYILSQLATATSTWTRVPLLNYTYDTTAATNNYGVLTCANGSCTITGSATPIATNVRARLITAEEVTALTVAAGASSDSIAGQWTLAKDNSYWYYFSNSDVVIGTQTDGTGSQTLSWLLENTGTTTSNSQPSGATANSYSTYGGGNLDEDNYGYWTLSPTGDKWDHVWRLWSGGALCNYYLVIRQDWGFGARPVITVSKSQLSS